MNHLTKPLFPFLVAVFALAYQGAVSPVFAQSPTIKWPRPIIKDPALEERRALLMAHGINPDHVSLLRFLEKGFPRDLPPNFPEDPLYKSEVVNAAIQELGITRSMEASGLLINIAEKKLTPGMEMVVRRDLEPEPLEIIDERKAILHRVFALNAIISLGLIGDEAAVPVVKKVMRTEPSPLFTIEGAIALGLMGSADGLWDLVEMAKNVESPNAVRAIETIYILTGRNYGLHRYTSLARKNEIVENLTEWYQTEGIDFTVYRAEVLRRRYAPPPPRPELDPTSLRGALQGTMDIDDADRRYYAREHLKKVAPSRIDELTGIAQDPMEDLDIRRAAMHWLMTTDLKKARKVIKDLRDDENEYIANSADVMYRRIKDALDRQ